MKKYGGKKVVISGEFCEGLVVEFLDDVRLVCRNYTKDKLGKKQITQEIKLDVYAVARQNNPKAKMKEIAKQLGREKFAVHEKVIPIIS